MTFTIDKIKWYFSRLKSMNAKEISWRTDQSFIKLYELIRYCSKPKSICSIKYGKHSSFDVANLKLTDKKEYLSIDYEPELIAGFLYDSHKRDWTYGYNTNNHWQNKPSYMLNYKGRDDIGDARINWQLNRHHQFPILAKNYYLTKEKKYLDELVQLFDSWNFENPFLFGISWTSPMEISIRCINWILTYFFIYKVSNNCNILRNLKTGIENMANYVNKHISNYSSANNHTVVELSCVLLTAVLTNDDDLIDKVFSYLTRELKRQNYPDGVNKEQSLHYQAFFLEAICLSGKILRDKGYDISRWKNDVSNLGKYIIDCLDKFGQAIEFGDNDEGYIIRLGKETNYYKYVVNFCNKVFDTPYSLEYSSETLAILLGQKEFAHNYEYNRVSSYKDGGVTLLRNNGNSLLIGIDHGPLGLEPIAAHGHADALSFQILLDGKHFLIDPGTYIYHINRSKRDYYRSTINHNTVCINNSNQSRIEGPFLWGKKANTKLVSIDVANKQVSLVAQHDGYDKTVSREFVFNDDVLIIYDEIGDRDGIANYSFGPKCIANIADNSVIIKLNDKTYTLCFKGSIINIKEKAKTYSPSYGIECSIPSIEITFRSKLTTTIFLKDSNHE